MIVFDKVRIAYKDRPVLNDVTLKIEDGEFFVLIGSSGCGKTTLLKSINKLLPLKSGSLSINGIPVKDVTVQDLPKMVGYVVQSGGLFPHMTVEENIALSVGRIAMLINVVVYSIGLFFFEQNIVVYSVIFGAVTYLTLDRMHLQNVTVTMLIITKSQDMEQLVFQYVGRGVTKWVGSGAYSKEPSDILLTVVSKKEAFALRKILKVYDPNVFVIMSEDTSVLGNFRKRLWA